MNDSAMPRWIKVLEIIAAVIAVIGTALVVIATVFLFSMQHLGWFTPLMYSGVAMVVSATALLAYCAGERIIKETEPQEEASQDAR